MRISGTVKCFDSDAQCGFIQLDNSFKFLPFNAQEVHFKFGANVSFVVQSIEGVEHAVQLRLIDAQHVQADALRVLSARIDHEVVDSLFSALQQVVELCRIPENRVLSLRIFEIVQSLYRKRCHDPQFLVTCGVRICAFLSELLSIAHIWRPSAAQKDALRKMIQDISSPQMEGTAVLRSESFLNKVTFVARNRCTRFVLVLDGLANTANVSAVLRSAEALGVQQVFWVFPRRLKNGVFGTISRGTQKWLSFKHFFSTQECIDHLKAENREIWSTCVDSSESIALSLDSINQGRLSLPESFAIVMGSEMHGVSDEFKKVSSRMVHLPMFGFVESLNVSVASALILQRLFDLFPSCRGSAPPCLQAKLESSWSHNAVASEQ